MSRETRRASSVLIATIALRLPTETNEDDESYKQDLDEGETNFQSPTTLQIMYVAQPKMLICVASLQ